MSSDYFARINNTPFGSTGTGLDQLVAQINTDFGLSGRISKQDVIDGGNFADQMNTILIEALNSGQVNLSPDFIFTVENVREINAYIRSDADRQSLWAQLHGDDDCGVETGYHLVQNDGGSEYFRGKNLVNTVADGIYHLGFEIVGGQILNEDGDPNATLEQLADWLTLFYTDRSTTDTGFDKMTDLILADAGLPKRISNPEIFEGADNANEMNKILDQAIQTYDLALDNEISVDDIIEINTYIREDDNRYKLWVELHGDDERGGEETGYHLVQNDGAYTRMFNQNFVNTVADGIYHLGFEIQGDRILNEDGDENAALADLADWVQYFYVDQSDTNTHLDYLVDAIKSDRGLACRTNAGDINGGAAAANAMNHMIIDAIDATGVVDEADAKISIDDVREINAYLRSDQNRYDRWVQLHGDDEDDGTETGFHLVQNDGANIKYHNDNLINTVADGIYHLGFEIQGDSILNEDLDANASLSDLATWLNDFYLDKSIVYGTTGADYLKGMNQDDQIFGQAGDDKIYAYAGNDLLYGEDGNDRLYAYEGDDHLEGGKGDDYLYGHEGNDTLLGGTGNDKLIGDQGDDRLEGGDGDDKLYGKEGKDYMEGGTGNDYFSAGDDDDFILGNSGNDKAYAGDGNDELIGGLGDDYLVGDDGDDLIKGDDGHDKLIGGAGDDILFGADGDDKLYGKEGKDFMDGGNGNDYFSGGAGIDTILTGEGNNTAYGGDADDMIIAGDGDDYLVGDAGNDLLEGHGGHDKLIGGAGIDRLYGAAGNDKLYGKEGDDFMDGDSGNDYFSGGDGGDEIQAGEGDDKAYGGIGDDKLYGGAGNDYLSGGDGNDLLEGHDGDDKLIGGAGIDQIYGADGHDKLYGYDGNDYMDGSTGDDYFSGGAGDDLILAGDGNDKAYGGDDNDTIIGGAGDDYLKGDNGDDIIEGNDGNDILSGGVGDDTLLGGAGNDTFYGHDGSDQMVGGSGDDYLKGYDGNDRLYGDDGDDRLYGYNDDDTLYAGMGSDTLYGGNGNDRLISIFDGSDDTLKGEQGADQFVFEQNGDQIIGNDVVRDFYASQGDQIIFQGVNLAVSIDDSAGTSRCYSCSTINVSTTSGQDLGCISVYGDPVTMDNIDIQILGISDTSAPDMAIGF